MDLLKMPRGAGAQSHGYWRASCTLVTVAISLQALLAEPNPDDALVPSLASLMLSHPSEYNRIVREHAMVHAKYVILPQALPSAMTQTAFLPAPPHAAGRVDESSFEPSVLSFG